MPRPYAPTYNTSSFCIVDPLSLPLQIIGQCYSVPYYRLIFQQLFHPSNSRISIFFKWWRNFDILLPLVLFSSLRSDPFQGHLKLPTPSLFGVLGSFTVFFFHPPFSIALSTQTLQRRNKANMADLKESVLECSLLLLKWLFCYFRQLSTVQSRACSTCISPFSFSTTSHETAAPPYQSDITTSKSDKLCTSIKCLRLSTCDLDQQNSWKQCPCRDP